jgi:hypothetical protein
MRALNLQKCPPNNPDKLGINRNIPFRGEENELIYMAGGKLPVVLKKIVDMILNTLNMKKEIDNWAVRVFPPAEKVNNQTSINMGKASLSVAKRVIAVFGTVEIADINAKVQGREGTGKVLLFNEECFELQFSVAPHIEISFSNAAGKVGEQKKGWRNNKIKTDPTRRIVVAVDFFVNTEILVNTIKKEAAQISNGNQDTEKALINAMTSNGQLSDIQNVIKDAKLVKRPETSTVDTDVEDAPALVPIKDILPMYSS